MIGNEWYSLEPILSRGARLNFVIGERSAGKTYAFKDYAFNDWIKNNAKGLESLWVYSRRSVDEINIAKKTLWNDYLPQKGYEVKSKGIECFIRPTFIEEEYEDEKGKIRKTQPEPWELFGYFIAITEAQNYKGAAFPTVTKLCLDEFIIENKRRQYIPGEVDQFLGLLHTVFRRRKVNAICLSNSGAIANPYFAYYGVKSKDFAQTKWVKRNKGNVIFEYYEGNRTQQEKDEDDIAKISGDSYRDYAMSNKFKDSSEELVAKKPVGAAPFIKLTADGKRWFTLYSSSKANGGGLWLKDVDSLAKGFALNPTVVSSDTTFDKKIVDNLKEKVDRREISFASPDVRAIFLNEIKRI